MIGNPALVTRVSRLDGFHAVLYTSESIRFIMMVCCLRTPYTYVAEVPITDREQLLLEIRASISTFDMGLSTGSGHGTLILV